MEWVGLQREAKKARKRENRKEHKKGKITKSKKKRKRKRNGKKTHCSITRVSCWVFEISVLSVVWLFFRKFMYSTAAPTEVTKAKEDRKKKKKKERVKALSS